MKLLYCVVVLGLIQYGLTAVPVKPSRQQLLQYYQQELNKVYKEQCASLKPVLEKLLQDNTIKQGSSHTFQNFKNAANLFLKHYPSYTHSGRYNDLLNDLDSMSLEITFPKVNKDVEYIFKSMDKYGYWDVFTKYTKSYVSVVKEKFIPKFEEYKKQLKPEELKQQQALMEWFKNLKNCSHYECYYKYFNEFPQKIKS
ncbi:hypothetical protein DOY81_000513 [Sarcophaga bullata]|nr:hypothetical protein DOY81_000513 [Sarcophaga bullata]